MVIRIAHLYLGNALTAGSAGPNPILRRKMDLRTGWIVDSVAELGAVGGP